MARRLGTRQAGLGMGSLLALLAALGLGLVIWNVGATVRIDDAGMAPVLLPGDTVYALTRSYRRRDPQPGEVVAFRLALEGVRRHPPDRRPQLPTGAFVGRIIGLPGDLVETRRDSLRINEQRVRADRQASDYVDPRGRKPKLWTEWLGPANRSYTIARGERPEPELAPTRVDPGRYLLFGDFRTEAHDGRYWGTVHRDDLLGPVLLVLFSRDPETGAVRWSRLGKFPN
jgi:signal peptidase I